MFNIAEHGYGASQQLEDATTKAAVLAQSLGGHLYVQSSEDEVNSVESWASQFYDDSFASDAKVGQTTGIDCGTYASVCNALRGYAYYVAVGAVVSPEGVSWVTEEEPEFAVQALYGLKDVNLERLANRGRTSGYVVFNMDCSRLAHCINEYSVGARISLIEIPGVLSKEQLEASLAEIGQVNMAGSFADSAILNQWHDPNIYHWMRFLAPNTDAVSKFFNESIDLSGVFWGTRVSEKLIRKGVSDYESDFNKMPISLAPISDSPPVNAYPFVADLKILDADSNERADQRFSSEQTVWRVTFNRDMNQEVQPFVTFGPDEPYTDFIVPGAWVNARTWEGRVTISPVATDGYQYVRVAGAVAADDPWLVTGDDKRRFRFEVITSGTESLNLQASGGEGYVDLSWNQDDYDTLLGFNLYRSTQIDGTYQRINQTLVGNEDRSYR